MQLLTNKFNQIATQIDATNAQITALQAHLSELQEHQQQLLSVEQACQSALSQADTALMMLNHVDPTQIEIFKEAMASKFAPRAIGILEPAAEPEPAPAPEPVAPAPDVPIDVSVTATPEPTEPEPTTEMDIEQKLNKLPLPSLRSLAKSKGIDGRGTKANLARRLKMLITNVDLRALA